MEKIFGFLGCGNMGSALLRAAAKAVGGAQIRMYDPDQAKVKALEEECGAAGVSLEELVKSADFLFLGVKPQIMPSALEPLKSLLKERGDSLVLVSMAAGLTIDTIRKLAGADYPVIRIMPNLAASVGEGMILYDTKDVKPEDVEAFLKSLAYAGKLCPLEEKLIDAGSAISGCGPAYVDIFMEAMADAGVSLGLTRDKAYLLASQTVLGAAKLMQESGKHPGELKDAVTSPGGTTIAGVLALEKGGFRHAASEAVIAAYKRTLELK